MPRVLAIGLDAADLGVLEQWAAEGRLPHIARLLAEGRRAVVHHPADYRAELPWTTFWTGRSPRANRYWGTLRFDPATYRVVEGGALRAEPFYARWPGPVIALDVPHCPPWPGVAGVQVAAWGAHSPQVPRSSLPAGLATRLERHIGPHPAFEADSQPGWHSPPYLDALVDALTVGARRRAEAAVWLAGEVPDWSLLLTVFSELHSAGHHLWHGVDPTHPLAGEGLALGARGRLARVHEAIDAAVGRVLSLGCESTVVVLFSVHGTVANANDLPALHLVPELLHRLAGHPALLEGSWGQPDRPHRIPAERVALGDVLAGLHHLTPAGRGRAALRRARRALRPAPEPWYRVTAAAVPERPAGDAYDGRSPDYLGTARYQQWWSRQRVFALPTFSDTHLRVNLAGREAAGIVAPDDYLSELAHWERQLRSCRDPRTGRPVALDVSRPRVADPYDADAPPADLVVRFGEVLDALDHPTAGRIGPLPFLRTGEHGGTGFAVVRGAPELSRIPSAVDLADLAELLGQFARA
jgi:predicted AlkP superfamily phosphohydrolase/phosphomutase